MSAVREAAAPRRQGLFSGSARWWVARRRGAGVAALVVARVPRHAAQLHRHGHAGGARAGGDDRRGRHRLVRPAGLRRHRRLCDGGAHGARGRLALAGSGGQPRAGGRLRGADRLGHAAPLRPLPVDRHHRLGHRDLPPVRQPAAARPVQRHRQRAAGVAGRLGLRQRPQVLPVDLGLYPGRAGSSQQPARLAAGPRDPRAALSLRDGRELRRRHRRAQAGGVRPGRAAGRAGGLAARALPALRQPPRLRRQCRHRLPVHGRHRRRQPCLGRAGRRGHHDGGQGMAQGRDAPVVPARRQLRNHRVRRAHDPAAAAHPRRPGAGAGALVAGAAAGRAAARGHAAAAAPRAPGAGHAAAGSEGPAKALRRAVGGQGAVVRHAFRRDPGADRPQRRRQEHGVQPDQRHPARRAPARSACSASASTAIPRATSPGAAWRAASST